MDADDGLRASDRHRLVGIDGGPDAALVTKERLNHLQSAFDELSDVHTKVLVMRELEGMSYREIGDKLDLTRPAVESALFRARRRLESEYQEIADGRRCKAMRATLARMVEGTHRAAEEHRLARHLKRCHSCRHRARVLGLEPQVDARSAAGQGGGAAPAPMALPPLGRRRRRHHRTVLHRRERGSARGARRGPRGSGGAGGCGRRGNFGWSAPGGPRDDWGGSSRGRAIHVGERGIAARHSRACHGRGARGTAPDVRAETIRSGRGPRGRFGWLVQAERRLDTAAPVGWRRLRAAQPDGLAPVGARYLDSLHGLGATPSGPGAGAATGDHPARAGPDAAGGEACPTPACRSWTAPPEAFRTSPTVSRTRCRSPRAG